jgi:hypothetical protein
VAAVVDHGNAHRPLAALRLGAGGGQDGGDIGVAQAGLGVHRGFRDRVERATDPFGRPSSARSESIAAPAQASTDNPVMSVSPSMHSTWRPS